MFLGIEIGGTKLQLGVGSGADANVVGLERLDINPSFGARGILDQIAAVGSGIVGDFPIQGIGIGFGGPVDARHGRTIKSHQIVGWEDFPLAAWAVEQLGLPAIVWNDCDAAAVAEARMGAGMGARRVFYVTVGTGVGGGLVVDGSLYGEGRPAAAEIGHLRLGMQGEASGATVESMASGRGIEEAGRRRIAACLGPRVESDDVAGARSAAAAARTLLQRCTDDPGLLTARMVAEAAGEGDVLAQDIMTGAVNALGWGIAQALTLLAPEVVVVGGGVSLAGERLFFEPLREQVGRNVFAPLAGTYEIVASALGESVVVVGAICAAAQMGGGGG